MKLAGAGCGGFEWVFCLHTVSIAKNGRMHASGSEGFRKEMKNLRSASVHLKFLEVEGAQGSFVVEILGVGLRVWHVGWVETLMR